MLTNRLHMVKIREVVVHSEPLRTLTFDGGFDAQPGQFVMVWVPGVDEVPMALSSIREPKAVTLQVMGEATRAMAGMREGDVLGVRGPYGNTFTRVGDRVLFVGGGTGMASIVAAVESPAFRDAEVRVAQGARTADYLLFGDRCEAAGAEVLVATDDGSKGHHGFVTDIVEEIVDAASCDQIITCGPEIMMKKVVDMAMAADIPVWASLERVMKCGFGVCDACSMGPILVCRDGPILRGEDLAGNAHFGRYRRDHSGALVPLWDGGD